MLYIVVMMISYQLIIYISICQSSFCWYYFSIEFDKTILMNVNQHIHIRWLTLSVLVPHLHNPTQVKLWRFLQSLHSLNVCKAHICLMSHSFYYLLRSVENIPWKFIILWEDLFHFRCIYLLLNILWCIELQVSCNEHILISAIL